MGPQRLAVLFALPPLAAPLGRLFDLVLYSPVADVDLRAIREVELGGVVDIMIFASTSFLFRDGSRRDNLSRPGAHSTNATATAATLVQDYETRCM